MKRYIKNMNTGAIFPYDEMAIADDNRDDIMECTADGDIDIPKIKAGKELEETKKVEVEEKEADTVAETTPFSGKPVIDASTSKLNSLSERELKTKCREAGIVVKTIWGKPRMIKALLGA